MHMPDISLDTPLGAVAAKVFGAEGGELVVCVQGKSAHIDVVEEWYPTATALAAAGRRVLVPNLHSNPATKPGVVSSAQLSAILLAACEHFKAKSIFLLGKSWGGGEALLFAASQPSLVTHLVMVAPSLSDASAIGRVKAPCLLFWARDDTVKAVSHAEQYKAALDSSHAQLDAVSAP